MEVEAVDEGMLGKIVIPEGTEDVAVNTPIAVIAENGEDVVDAGRRGARPPRRRAPRRSRAAAVADGARPSRRRRRPRRRRAADAASPNTPAPRPSTITVREALRDAMAEEMRRDETCS